MWCSGGSAEFAVSHSAKVAWSSRRLFAARAWTAAVETMRPTREIVADRFQALSPRRPAEAAAWANLPAHRPGAPSPSASSKPR